MLAVLICEPRFSKFRSAFWDIQRPRGMTIDLMRIGHLMAKIFDGQTRMSYEFSPS